MKTLIITLSAVLALTMGDILEIGKSAPMTDVKMKDVSGIDMSLEDMKQKNGLVVIFSCNTCPFVVGGRGEGWEGRYNKMHDMCAENNIGMVLVNSNEAKRDGDDSFEEMQAHAKKEGYKSHYVVDNNHKLADAFGAKTTPHVFMFDADMNLAYKGAIDDNVDSSADVKETWLQNAISNLAAGKPIDPNSTRNSGCSIKRAK